MRERDFRFQDCSRERNKSRYKHAYTHTRAHAPKHTHEHTHAHTCTHAHTHSESDRAISVSPSFYLCAKIVRVCVIERARVRMCVRANWTSPVYINFYTHIYMHTYNFFTHTYVHTYVYIYNIYMYTHVCIYT